MIEAFEEKKQVASTGITLCYNDGHIRNGDEHTVREDYERNKILIDLHAQPTELKER